MMGMRNWTYTAFEDVESFRSIPSSDFNERVARKIYSKYISQGARLQIDPGRDWNEEIASRLGSPQANMFDGAAQGVCLYLGRNTLPRLWKSVVWERISKQFPTETAAVFDKERVECGSGVNELVRSVTLRPYIQEFLNEDGSLGHLSFLEEVSMFRSLPTRHHIETQARKIHAKFLDAQSGQLEVLLPDEVLKRIEMDLSCPFPEIFTEAQQFVGFSMHKELLPSFRRSSRFKTLLQSALTVGAFGGGFEPPQTPTRRLSPVSSASGRSWKGSPTGRKRMLKSRKSLSPRWISPRSFGSRLSRGSTGRLSSDAESATDVGGDGDNVVASGITPAELRDCEIEDSILSKPGTPLGRGANYLRSRRLLKLSPGVSPRRTAMMQRQLDRNTELGHVNSASADSSTSSLLTRRGVLSPRIQAKLRIQIGSTANQVEGQSRAVHESLLRSTSPPAKFLSLDELDKLYEMKGGDENEVLREIERGKLVQYETGLCSLGVVRGCIVEFEEVKSMQLKFPGRTRNV